MDPNIWFWVWLGLAIILSVAEIFTAGFFMLPFGIGAAVAAAIALIFPIPEFPQSIAWQWVAFIGISSALLIVLRRIANRLAHDSPVGLAGNRLIGKVGVVIDRLDPVAGTGRIRVEREEWRADAAGHGPIEAGSNVEVVAVEGTHLKVRPTAEPTLENR